ncbi:hypothetical protein PV325_001643, partial [Microctonus aethiopoides]
TIAEREHKKWENAPPIENNPYSQENIQKRLLERQYSRRSSDVNGNSAVLPTTPCPSLQIVIGSNRPDMRRFGRDYYINESKSPTGERSNPLGTSISSRPSSSLSHHSNSTSSDFEQQVSHGLDTFEESSLRGSLQRRTYRGTNITSNFVINPLIHMDYISDEIEYNNKNYIDFNDKGELDKSSDISLCELHQNNFDDSVNNFDINSSHYFESNFSHSTINPLYNDENELMQKFIGDTIVDRDSGMYSTDSNEFEYLKNENNLTEKNHSFKLNCYNNNNFNHINENEICIVNGKKYWLLNSQKFHTFGGIKRRRIKINFDDDFYDTENGDFYHEHLTNIDTDFSKFKFQTFGGIKYRNKIDRIGIDMYKNIRARPSIKLFTNATKHSMKTNDRYFSTPSERSLKRTILDDKDNLKLEPPVEPIIIEKIFTNLSDMRKRRHNNANEFPENFEPIEAASKSLELKQNNDILERERKNSKNEINAKLNNRGNFDSIATIFDAKKTFGDDDKRKIRRIDLRAYGFENEFNINNENIKKKQQRIPNKLDLRSYGYDSGLRRTQSNNHIDSKVNNSYVDTKINSEGVNEKSNLSHQLYKVTTDDDYHWSQSTENLIEKNKIFEKFDGIKSAKSVPNITKSGLYLCQGHNGQSIKNDNDEEIHFNGNSKIDNSKEIINDDIIDSTNDINNYESDSLSTKTTSTDELPQKFTTEKKIKYSLESLEDSDKFIDKQLPMPSVKVLAQAFNTKSPTSTDMPISKISRSAGNVRERPTTPEIHIIGTPRQMHSLTARSISREFREGLRQITNKSNTPSVNTTIIEQSKMPAGSSKLDSNELENNYNTETIAPGKLKNNIQFWEQLQKKKLM